MKKLVHIEEMASCGGNDSIYVTEDNVHVRDVMLDVGIGEELLIGHISDIHINCVGLEESVGIPASVYNLRRCLSVLDDVDQLVINGDTLHYLSEDTMEWMDSEVWDKLPDAIVNTGGHERTLRKQDAEQKNLSLEERYAILEKYWRRDLYYQSRLLKGKVMVVGLCDDRATINEETLENLRADIEICREKGYIMLIFAHEPVATRDPVNRVYTEEMAMTVGPLSSMPFDLCDGVVRAGTRLLGNPECDSRSLEAYDLITNSADVIKGFFAGHLHHDMNMMISAKAGDGGDAVIPQYITTTASYDGGHLMRILVK